MNTTMNNLPAAAMSGRLWFAIPVRESAAVVAEPIVGGAGFETVYKELVVKPARVKKAVASTKRVTNAEPPDPQRVGKRGPAGTGLVTPGELEILSVLWARGTMTVREVHEQLTRKRNVAHTTVAAMMQLMERKGQLAQVSERRPFRYETITTPGQAKDTLLGDIQNRMFAGSMTKMALHLLESKGMSKEQLREIQTLLGELE